MGVTLSRDQIEIETNQESKETEIHQPIATRTSKFEVPTEEVTTTINKLKNRKTAGVDDISNEMIKYRGNKIIQERKIAEE